MYNVPCTLYNVYYYSQTPLSQHKIRCTVTFCNVQCSRAFFHTHTITQTLSFTLFRSVFFSSACYQPIARKSRFKIYRRRLQFIISKCKFGAFCRSILNIAFIYVSLHAPQFLRRSHPFSAFADCAPTIVVYSIFIFAYFIVIPASTDCDAINSLVFSFLFSLSLSLVLLSLMRDAMRCIEMDLVFGVPCLCRLV